MGAASRVEVAWEEAGRAAEAMGAAGTAVVGRAMAAMGVGSRVAKLRAAAVTAGTPAGETAAAWAAAM